MWTQSSTDEVVFIPGSRLSAVIMATALVPKGISLQNKRINPQCDTVDGPTLPVGLIESFADG